MSHDTMKLATASCATVLGGLYLFLSAKSEDIPRDLRFIYKLIKGKRFLSPLASRTGWSMADMWAERAVKFADKKCLVFVEEDGSTRSYTYREVDELSNQVANWAISSGLKSRQIVALMMDNRPEFVFTWLGLAKCNIGTALINTNLNGRPLLHSLDTAKTDTFIIGTEHTPEIEGLRKSIQNDETSSSSLRHGKYYCWGGRKEGFSSLDDLLAQQPKKLLVPPPADRKAKDVLFYIYTSGTTGLPKASVISHMRAFMGGYAFSDGFELTSNDVIYNTLPVYHSAGGMLGISMCWYQGATLVFRKKFSARRFWIDCIQNNCTVIQYIGELCRYLLAQPEVPEEKQHKIRLAIGNGLRPDIWRKFQQRFNIKQIGEFYASTEGNASLLNVTNQEGAVGFLPPLILKMYPVTLVKYSVENDELVRGKNGLCVPCAEDEPGELLGLIDENDALRDVSAYTDKKATEKKVVHDVLKKGDKWFKTGDLLKVNKGGHYFFVDRIGDTFRWKGENVSTGEVELVINQLVPGVREVTVYGVTMEGHDGRCGMACIVKSDEFSLEKFYETIMKELPSYAAPLFVRLKDDLEITTTFKHKKAVLVQEGYNVHTLKDPVYMRNDALKKFVPVTEELYQELLKGGQTPKAKL